MTAPYESRFARSTAGVVALAIAWLGVAIGFEARVVEQSRGQEPPPLAAARPGIAEPHAYLGVERCEDCHLAPSPTRVNRGVTNFVALDESKIWLEDIHSRAFALIDPATSELSRQICERLGIEDLRQSQACLSCHSSWLKGQPRPPTYERGVACESCHGPSEHWDVPHTREDWRAKPVAEKSALGMIDVRNPIVRAEQCFSCHIGNVAEGKVLTHAMYAAGHPPLPNIEVESFATQMPPHWRYLRDKPDFALRSEFIRENSRYLLPTSTGAPDPVARHRHGAAAVVLGGVIALRESLELAADLADAEPRAWPELAAFDCAACHHDLRYPGWRRTQLELSPPGRPPMPQWPTALVRTAILHVSPNRQAYERQLVQFDEGLHAIRRELEAVPFGQADRMRSACLELAEWLTRELAVKVASRPLDEASIRRSIQMLALQGANTPQDYHSARQIAWAIRTLYCDLEKKPPSDANIREQLTALSASLGLNLPNGQTDLCVPSTIGETPREIIPLADSLSESLIRAADFEPARFQEQMRELVEALR